MRFTGLRSSGKTTFALQSVAEGQELRRNMCYIDAEHALEIADTLVRSEAVGVLVVDSVATLVPKAELEGEDGRVSHGPSSASYGL